MRDDRYPRNLACAVRGPIILITLGVLFWLNNFYGIGFDRTWPVLLIIFGLMSLMRRSFDPPPPPPPPPNYYQPPAYNPYPPQPTSGSGGYTQSTYSQPGPAKGGFGTTAPAKPETEPKGDTI